MSIEENKALVHRLYEEISKGNLAIVDELIAAYIVAHSICSRTKAGAPGYIRDIEGMWRTEIGTGRVYTGMPNNPVGFVEDF